MYTKRSGDMTFKHVVMILLGPVGAAATDTLATPTLDQSNLGGGTLRNRLYLNRQEAQTLTVGLAGTLDSIMLDLGYDRGAPTHEITVQLRGTTNGLPNGASQALASVQFDASVVTADFTLYSVDFSSFSIPVAVGDQLAIVLFSDVEGYYGANWRGGRDDPYPGGKWYHDYGTGTTWGTATYEIDAFFQTYVETDVQPGPSPEPGNEPGAQPIPAPAGLHLVVMGLVYLARQRRQLR
jgi:hypothetical protein